MTGTSLTINVEAEATRLQFLKLVIRYIVISNRVKDFYGFLSESLR